MKRLILVAFVLAVALFWWMRPSRDDTRSASRQSTSRAESPPRQPAAEAAPADSRDPAELAMAGKQAAIAKVSAGKRAAGQGQGGSVPPPPPLDSYRGLNLSAPKPINERPWHVLGARAIPRTRYSASMGKILFEQNGYAIVEQEPAGQDDGWTNLVFREGDRPVVVNPSNGRLAIVTGTLAVKLKDFSAAEDLAARGNLRVLAADDSISTIYVRPADGAALLDEQSRLRRDPRVERVEIEIDQNRKVAK